MTPIEKLITEEATRTTGILVDVLKQLSVIRLNLEEINKKLE